MKKVLYIFLFIIIGFSIKFLLSYDYPIVLYIDKYKITSSIFVVALSIISFAAFMTMSAKFIVGTLTFPNRIAKALIYKDPVKSISNLLDNYISYIAYGTNMLKNPKIKNLSDPYVLCLALLSSTKMDDQIQYAKLIVGSEASDNIKFIAYKELAKSKLMLKNYDSALLDAMSAYKINNTPEIIAIIIQIALEAQNPKLISEYIGILEELNYSELGDIKRKVSDMFFEMASKNSNADQELALDYIKASLKYNPVNFDAIKLGCELSLKSSSSNEYAIDIITNAMKTHPSFELFLLYKQYNPDGIKPITIQSLIDTEKHPILHNAIKTYLSTPQSFGNN